MLSTRRFPRTRLANAFATIAVLSLAGLGFTAVGSHAAGGSNCENGLNESKRFTVGVEGSEIRELVMCTEDSSTEVLVTAQALAVGLVRASDGPRAGRRAQLSALANLRLMRERNLNDLALSADERSGRLALINKTIKALERDLSESS